LLKTLLKISTFMLLVRLLPISTISCLLNTSGTVRLCLEWHELRFRYWNPNWNFCRYLFLTLLLAVVQRVFRHT
jgi:hypothetical protein